MDTTAYHDGYFLAGSINLAESPGPAPWLRLAHHQTYDRVDSSLARERSILDYEFIVQHGSGSWIAFPQHNGSAILPPGAVALIPPGLRHGQASPPGSHYAVHFDICPNPSLVAPAMLRPSDRSVGRGARELQPVIKVNAAEVHHECSLVLIPDDPAWWIECARTLMQLWLPRRQTRPEDRLRTMAILSEMLSTFLFRTHSAHRDTDPVVRVNEVLTQADVFDRTVSVANLAQRAGVGESTFRTVVRSLTGTTPAAWLERRRCEQAVMMLRNTALPVRSVAQASGYDDPYHFSRVIRRLYGDSPRTIRDGGAPGMAERDTPPR